MEIPTSEQSLQATSTSFLEQAQQTAYGLLTHFANQSNALQQLTTSFGNTFEAQLATAILAQWQEQDFNHLPDVEVLPGKALRGANGGFAASTNRIYISEQFIHQAEQFDYLTGLTHVLLEETGHAVDALLNVKDTPGDEGDIFARLVQGHRLDPAEISQLSIEDDFSWISLNGQEVLLEMSYPSIVSDQASDFNGDGKSDIFWRHSDGSVAAWLMDGTQTLAMSLLGSGPVEQAWQVENVADFNGDGKSDIFWRHSDGSVATWLMNGTQTLAMSLLGSGPVEQAWQVEDIADFNGDGKSDIFWRHSDGSVATWLMNGTQTLAMSLLGSGPVEQAWQVEGIADFNGDGKSDIFWRHSDGSVATWLMDGTQTLAMSLLGSGPVEQAWQVEGIADFNGDGKSDIFWRHSDGSVATWLMNGTQTLAMSLLGSGPVEQAWQVEGTADFNGDGKSDIFWRHSDGSVATWLMNGTQTLAMSLLGNTPVAQGWQPWPFQTQFILPPSPPPVKPPPPEQSGSVTVTAPNGGSALQTGSTYDITWTDNLSGNVRIDLYALQPPGSLPGVPSNPAPTPYPYRMIADSTPSDGSYSWTVPFDLPADYSYQVRISSLDKPEIFDTSDEFFNLTTDLKKYWFVYDFNPSDYRSADSYGGSVIAPAGMYQVTELDGDYIDGDYVDPIAGNTEAGLNGKYLVYAVEDYDDSLLNEAGRVFVHNYIDRDNGRVQHVEPYGYQQGLPSGYAYLGSEFDFIDDSQSEGSRFGEDFYEADPPADSWTVEYFANMDLAGSPALVEFLSEKAPDSTTQPQTFGLTVSTFAQNWGENSPSTRLSSGMVPVDNFSARFTKRQDLAAGLYRVETFSDDGIRVRVDNKTVISDWEVQPDTTDGGYYSRATSGYTDPVSGYFSPPSPSPGGGFIGGYTNPVEGYSKVPTANIGYFYWEGGEAPITVEYFEAIGEAKLSFELAPVVNKLPRQGQTVVYTWAPEEGQPSLEMLQTGIAHPQAITDGVILDYTRPDGKQGILANWEDLSPFPTVPKDFFAIQSYVETYLDDREYEFTIRADDGYQILAQQQSTGEWFYITPPNVWEQASGIPQAYSWTPDESGMYDLYFHYYEDSGNAYIDLSWETVKFEDPVAPGEWNATVYNWEQSGRPSADMLKTGIPHPEVLGRISLGNATRADGKPGIDALWTDSPNNDSRLPADNFAIQSHTQAYFDGSEYEFSVIADDGYQLLARQQGTNQWFYITPENQWEDGYTSSIEYRSKPPAGNYDLYFLMYEKTGDAAIDLSWEKVVTEPITGDRDGDETGGDPGGSDGSGSGTSNDPRLKQLTSAINFDLENQSIWGGGESFSLGGRFADEFEEKLDLLIAEASIGASYNLEALIDGGSFDVDFPALFDISWYPEQAGDSIAVNFSARPNPDVNFVTDLGLSFGVNVEVFAKLSTDLLGFNWSEKISFAGGFDLSDLQRAVGSPFALDLGWNGESEPDSSQNNRFKASDVALQALDIPNTLAILYFAPGLVLTGEAMQQAGIGMDFGINLKKTSMFEIHGFEFDFDGQINGNELFVDYNSSGTLNIPLPTELAPGQEFSFVPTVRPVVDFWTQLESATVMEFSADFGKIGDPLLGKAPAPVKNIVEGAWPKFKYQRNFELPYVKLKEFNRFDPYAVAGVSQSMEEVRIKLG